MLLTPVGRACSSRCCARRSAPGLEGLDKGHAWRFLKGHVVVFLQLLFLLHQAMLSLDAIWRSVLRVFVTKKRLLEWETAAEAEDAKRRTSTVDVYLAWSPLLATVLACLVWLVRPAALPVAAPILSLWFMARFLSAWLNRAPRTGQQSDFEQKDVDFLREDRLAHMAVLPGWSCAETNWLIPDNVREDGISIPRLSPTNLGFLLDARIAAVTSDISRFRSSQRRPIKTLQTVRKLPKYKGHILNWYSNESLRSLDPALFPLLIAAILWLSLDLETSSPLLCGEISFR